MLVRLHGSEVLAVLLTLALILWRVGPLLLLVVGWSWPLLLLVIRRSWLIGPFLRLIGLIGLRIIGPVRLLLIIGLVGPLLLLIVGRSWALLLLVVRWCWAPGLLIGGLIRSFLRLIWLVGLLVVGPVVRLLEGGLVGPLRRVCGRSETALDWRSRTDRVGARNIAGNVRSIGTLLVVTLCRVLVVPLAILHGALWRCDNDAAGDGPRRGHLFHRRSNRRCVGPSCDLFALLVDEHRALV